MAAGGAVRERRSEQQIKVASMRTRFLNRLGGVQPHPAARRHPALISFYIRMAPEGTAMPTFHHPGEQPGPARAVGRPFIRQIFVSADRRRPLYLGGSRLTNRFAAFFRAALLGRLALPVLHLLSFSFASTTHSGVFVYSFFSRIKKFQDRCIAAFQPFC